MKEFTKPNVRIISDRIQSALDELSKELGIEIKMGGGSFTPDSFTLKVKGAIKNADGSVYVSDDRHSVANHAAYVNGIVYEGPNVIGTIWKSIKGDFYKIVGYDSKKRSYPVLIEDADGKKLKTSFKSSGTFFKQLTQPSLEHFTVWFTEDPDSDAISEAKVEICDSVQEFMNMAFPISEGDELFHLIDKLNDLGIAKKNAKQVYLNLFGNSTTAIKDTIIYIKSQIKKSR